MCFAEVMVLKSSSAISSTCNAGKKSHGTGKAAVKDHQALLMFVAVVMRGSAGQKLMNAIWGFPETFLPGVPRKNTLNSP